MKNEGRIHEECAEDRRKQWQEKNKDTVIVPGMFAKIKVSDEYGTEHMWFMVKKVKDNIIYATLDNDPLKIKSIKYGDSVKFDKSEISDIITSE